MDCASPNTWPYWMFSVHMTSLGGRWGRQRGGGGAVCRRSAPWGIGQEKVIVILVGSKMTKREGRIIPVLAVVGYTADIFLYPTLRYLEDIDLKGLLFPELPAVWCGGGAPWLVSSRGFTCRIK